MYEVSVSITDGEGGFEMSCADPEFSGPVNTPHEFMNTIKGLAKTLEDKEGKIFMLVTNLDDETIRTLVSAQGGILTFEEASHATA